MQAKRIVFFDINSLESVLATVNNQLNNLAIKWFGEGDGWSAGVECIAESESAGLNMLPVLMADERLIDTIGWLALNQGYEEYGGETSPLVHQLGKHIMEEFVLCFVVDERDESECDIMNPYDPPTLLKFVVSIRGDSWECLLPQNSVISLFHQPLRRSAENTLSRLTADDVPGVIRLNAVLNSTDLRLKELLALDVGDVLTLEHGLDMPVLFQSESGAAVFEGQLIMAGNKRSMLLTGAAK